MMKVEILTPKGIEFDREVKEVVIPTRSGQIAVLPHHVQLISVLKAGKIRIITDKEEIEKEIEGGILEVCKDRVVILLKKF